MSLCSVLNIHTLKPVSHAVPGQANLFSMLQKSGSARCVFGMNVLLTVPTLKVCSKKPRDPGWVGLRGRGLDLVRGAN